MILITLEAFISHPLVNKRVRCGMRFRFSMFCLLILVHVSWKTCCRLGSDVTIELGKSIWTADRCATEPEGWQGQADLVVLAGIIHPTAHERIKPHRRTDH
jgi:hypothetical protein